MNPTPTPRPSELIRSPQELLAEGAAIRDLFDAGRIEEGLSALARWTTAVRHRCGGPVAVDRSEVQSYAESTESVREALERARASTATELRQERQRQTFGDSDSVPGPGWLDVST